MKKENALIRVRCHDGNRLVARVECKPLLVCVCAVPYLSLYVVKALALGICDAKMRRLWVSSNGVPTHMSCMMSVD